MPLHPRKVEDVLKRSLDPPGPTVDAFAYRPQRKSSRRPVLKRSGVCVHARNNFYFSNADKAGMRPPPPRRGRWRLRQGRHQRGGSGGCSARPSSHLPHPSQRPMEGGSGALGGRGGASRGGWPTPAQPHSPIVPAPASTTPARHSRPDERSLRAAGRRRRHPADYRRRRHRRRGAAPCCPDGGVGSHSSGGGINAARPANPPTAASTALAASHRDGRRGARGLHAAGRGHRPASARRRRHLDRDAAERGHPRHPVAARPRADAQLPPAELAWRL